MYSKEEPKTDHRRHRNKERLPFHPAASDCVWRRHIPRGGRTRDTGTLSWLLSRGLPKLPGAQERILRITKSFLIVFLEWGRKLTSVGGEGIRRAASWDKIPDRPGDFDDAKNA